MGAKSSLTRAGGANQLVSIRKLARALLEEVQSLEEGEGQRAETGDATAGDAGFYEAVKAYEIFLIRRALLKAGGNRALAARLLGLKPTTLHQKMKAYEIKADQKTTGRGDCVAP